MSRTARNNFAIDYSTAPKNEGRGTYRFFEAAMGSVVRDRRLLGHDPQRDLATLRLVYQPQKDIRDGKMIGFEALLRWKHATRGDVTPAEFIPIAEETGIIHQIGEWVLGPLAPRRRAGRSR